MPASDHLEQSNNRPHCLLPPDCPPSTVGGGGSSRNALCACLTKPQCAKRSAVHQGRWGGTRLSGGGGGGPPSPLPGAGQFDPACVQLPLTALQPFCN